MTTSTHELTHEAHDHAHGEGCGHVSFTHVTTDGEHVDFAHDGHVHTQHDDHWDECGQTPDHLAHDSHDHAHGVGCGHVAVPHDGHVDYVHDGHRHVVHDDHYDEH